MEELKSLHEQITELWKLVRTFYPVQANANDKYWEEVTTCANAYGSKYPKGTLGFYLLMGWLEFLQNTEKPKEENNE